MANTEWSYGTKDGLDRKLILAGFTVIEDDRITIHLRDQLISSTGAIVTDVTAGYSIVKGATCYDVDGGPLPKKNQSGEIQYEFDEEGIATDTPEARDNAYENIKYYIDNKIKSVYELIDAGVVERYKLS
tara:strand:- start:2605 stop:2994 length:390 start_codon:yes stop_codon:yes gene_type:complete